MAPHLERLLKVCYFDASFTYYICMISYTDRATCFCWWLLYAKMKVSAKERTVEHMQNLKTRLYVSTTWNLDGGWLATWMLGHGGSACDSTVIDCLAFVLPAKVELTQAPQHPRFWRPLSEVTQAACEDESHLALLKKIEVSRVSESIEGSSSSSPLQWLALAACWSSLDVLDKMISEFETPKGLGWKKWRHRGNHEAFTGSSYSLGSGRKEIFRESLNRGSCCGRFGYLLKAFYCCIETKNFEGAGRSAKADEH